MCRSDRTTHGWYQSHHNHRLETLGLPAMPWRRLRCAGQRRSKNQRVYYDVEGADADFNRTQRLDSLLWDYDGRVYTHYEMHLFHAACVNGDLLGFLMMEWMYPQDTTKVISSAMLFGILGAHLAWVSMAKSFPSALTATPTTLPATKLAEMQEKATLKLNLINEIQAGGQ